VGYFDAPLDFVPRDLCSWEHRFDDPEHEYRTIYCAEHKLTCLREVLADLRPNPNVRADFAQYQMAQGYPPDQLYEPARSVTMAWRRKHVLVQARVRHDGQLADIDDVELREQLERAHADLLKAHGMDHLNISEIRSGNRAVTQAISRDLYEQGAAGILFRSNLDDHRCLVVFEYAGELEDAGEPVIYLSDDVPELVEVCRQYGLLLRS
jgi:hypothetical protein